MAGQCTQSECIHGMSVHSVGVHTWQVSALSRSAHMAGQCTQSECIHGMPLHSVGVHTRQVTRSDLPDNRTTREPICRARASSRINTLVAANKATSLLTGREKKSGVGGRRVHRCQVHTEQSERRTNE